MKLSDATRKKPEMIRRSRVVKLAKKHSEVYELMSQAGGDPKFLQGYAEMIRLIEEEFDITMDEYQV